MKLTPIRRKIRLSGAAYEEGRAFLITINTAQRYPWFGRYPGLSDRTIGLILEFASTRKAAVYAWCVMPDHIHFLIQDDQLIDFVRVFKGKLTPLARSFENARPLWQRSFYDHALRREEALEDIALYIWQNPVRAGIVENPLVYQWSGSLVWPNWKEMLKRGDTSRRG